MLKIMNFLKVPNDNPALTVAQFEAFSKQVPLLYFILLTNMASLAWTHRDVAPAWLVIYLPSVLGIVFISRAIGWIVGRNRTVDAAQAYRKLRSTNRLAAPIAILCVLWSIALLPYGDSYQKAHVAFFMAITVIGVIFCLMHLRSAALVVTVLVNVPFFIVMVASGQPTFIATGINVVLVTFALIAVLLTHYRDFRQLNESRQRLLAQQEELTRQHREMQALSDENLRLANMDSLTLLANRRSFFDVLNRAFARAEEEGRRLSVGVLDLDGFKPVNDMYGHAAGDKVLVEVGRRLSGFARSDITVYRLGGDEFAIIHAGAHRDEDLLALGERVCQAVAASIDIGTSVVQVTTSMGFAVYPDIGTSGQDLYERADYALYTAKRTQRGGIVLFNAAQAKTLSRHREVEEVLMAADIEKEMSLVFQPIVDVATSRCVGFEALARWTSPTLGRVSPGEFIPIAEHSGRIVLITRHLLAMALAEARGWPGETFLSFNLSPHDIATPENVLRIISVVEASGFDPRRINFEITETAVTRDFAQAAKSIELLRHFGSGISLDDFGTGYSSLNHVHKLPLSKIKIDGSFVAQIDSRPASYKIVKSVLAMCEDMGLEAIVEGVETEAELSVLKDMGVEVVQGYHFSRPLEASAAQDLVQAEAGERDRRRVSAD
ncbi:putative bifunctional diguanylate cyclase/phosphodiesterase [Gellertiella hungarica]|uniref:Diguanylate cyclase (GGDEF)-like protein n=1 Tax=Gellertiella hungarica TaxID=1572859 RepID=A0A7W6J8A6_9HYPH|nr:EAL domain-containing protein [Gellertiella hungarica]MBB4066656.1 diguanylate cyclase (GGDEF)-like protein [Gellertiella hungarica]